MYVLSVILTIYCNIIILYVCITYHQLDVRHLGGRECRSVNKRYILIEFQFFIYLSQEFAKWCCDDMWHFNYYYISEQYYFLFTFNLL